MWYWYMFVFNRWRFPIHYSSSWRHPCRHLFATLRSSFAKIFSGMFGFVPLVWVVPPSMGLAPREPLSMMCKFAAWTLPANLPGICIIRSHSGFAASVWDACSFVNSMHVSFFWKWFGFVAEFTSQSSTFLSSLACYETEELIEINWTKTQALECWNVTACGEKLRRNTRNCLPFDASKSGSDNWDSVQGAMCPRDWGAFWCRVGSSRWKKAILPLKNHETSTIEALQSKILLDNVKLDIWYYVILCDVKSKGSQFPTERFLGLSSNAPTAPALVGSAFNPRRTGIFWDSSTWAAGLFDPTLDHRSPEWRDDADQLEKVWEDTLPCCDFTRCGKWDFLFFCIFFF